MGIFRYVQPASLTGKFPARIFTCIEGKINFGMDRLASLAILIVT